jgi:hypothetical protein
MIRWALYLSFLGFCLTRCLEAPTEPHDPTIPKGCTRDSIGALNCPDIKPPKP